jgi:hypothetical protein
MNRPMCVSPGMRRAKAGLSPAAPQERSLGAYRCGRFLPPLRAPEVYWGRLPSTSCWASILPSLRDCDVALREDVAPSRFAFIPSATRYRESGCSESQIVGEPSWGEGTAPMPLCLSVPGPFVPCPFVPCPLSRSCWSLAPGPFSLPPTGLSCSAMVVCS